MRDPHKVPYFRNEHQQPEVFMKSLTRNEIAIVVSLAVQEAAPLTVIMQIHHDSVCPCDGIGEIVLRHGHHAEAKEALLETVERCLCERLDLTLRTDMRDEEVAAARAAAKMQHDEDNA